MRIYPAVHYTMGGLWVDYNLMTSVPGLFAIGECNFSDHGANRLGASALMQGLADGYFIYPIPLEPISQKKLIASRSVRTTQHLMKPYNHPKILLTSCCQIMAIKRLKVYIKN